MMTIPLVAFVITSNILFVIGLFGVITQTNGIRILIAVEVMLNAANLNFIAFNSYLNTSEFAGWSFTLVTIAIAAAEVVIGLAIFISVYRNFEDITLGHIVSLGEILDKIPNKPKNINQLSRKPSEDMEMN